MISEVAAADLIAYTAHHGQKDKAGAPYIEHPRTVASFLDTEEEKVIALLHDVMEDTFITEADLRPVFGDRIVDTLLLLTRPDDMDYMDYIRRIKTSPLATRVKLADLRHNSDLTRISAPSEKDYARIEKYKRAAALLKE